LPFKIAFEQKPIVSGLAGWKEKLLSTNSKPSRYSLLIQKQSGIESELNTKIVYPDNWQPVWKIHDDILLQQHTATYHAELSRDMVFGIVMEKIE
jgi:hypothetical protein